jgi:hypothetical protein
MGPENNGPKNNRNGSWKSWVIGILSGLIIAAIVGSIVVDREVAALLSGHTARLDEVERVQRERLLSITSVGSLGTRLSAIETSIQSLRNDLDEIKKLAAQRGVSIPNLENNMRRVEDRLDRLERK